MKYIMVTDFDRHWDRIEGNFTSYSPKMIKPRSRGEKLVSGTDTVFIKRIPDSDEVEKAWRGRVWGIEKMPGKVFFRVEIFGAIEERLLAVIEESQSGKTYRLPTQTEFSVTKNMPESYRPHEQKERVSGVAGG